MLGGMHVPTQRHVHAMCEAYALESETACCDMRPGAAQVRRVCEVPSIVASLLAECLQAMRYITKYEVSPEPTGIHNAQLSRCRSNKARPRLKGP